MDRCNLKNRSTSVQTGKGILLAFLAIIALAAACTSQPSYIAAPQEGSDIVIDPASLQPDVPQFYTLLHEGKKISYFALKIDGQVSSFFDACASCYTHKQGYRYDAGAVTCRYCSMRFPVYKLEKGLGSCYPIKIDGRMENGKYRIPVASLIASANLF
jgi:uncharacterized membrane protein